MFLTKPVVGEFGIMKPETVEAKSKDVKIRARVMVVINCEGV